MKINRILTNNAVVVTNLSGNDQIVCGKGIGFKKRSGDEIDETLINQTFVLIPDGNLSTQLEQLLVDIPLEYVSLSNNIVKMAKVSMGVKLNDSLIISLADHIFETMRRYKENILISNGLIYEIQRFYEKEFEIGLLAKEMIEKTFDVKLPDDEAAYIAMHIVNAQTDNSTMEETMKMTKIIQDIIRIVRLFFSIQFDEKSGYYYRFLTHLKYFSRRVLRQETVKEEKSDLADIIFQKYASAYECTKKIEKYLISNLNYCISEEEKMYITIHIHSAVSKGSRKEVK